MSALVAPIRSPKCLPEMLPSKLISLALADLAKVERSRLYEVEMGTWHRGRAESPWNERAQCAVCLAGAVMAKTLRTPSKESVSPVVFDLRTDRYLNALNHFRVGNVGTGLVCMGHLTPVGVSYNFRVAVYSRAESLIFYRDMRKIVKTLKERGL